MDALLMLLGRLAGVIGLAVCAIAVMVRFGGRYVIGGFQVGTLLLAGIALLVAGCFALLLVVAHRTEKR